MWWVQEYWWSWIISNNKVWACDITNEQCSCGYPGSINERPVEPFLTTGWLCDNAATRISLVVRSGAAKRVGNNHGWLQIHWKVWIIIERRPLRALQSRRFARWIPKWREAIDQPPWVGLEKVKLLSIWNLAHSHWNGILPPRPLDFQVNSVTFWFFFVVTATTVVEISNLGTVKWQLL